jgi:putative iron-regulated protein
MRSTPSSVTSGTCWRFFRPLFRCCLSAALAVVAWLVCQGTAPGSEPTNEPDTLSLKRAVITNYAAVISATYQDSLGAAKELKEAIDLFLKEPSENGLAAARKAWLAARVPYSQSEAARFYDGPIDQVETKINSWPIDENYIDYVTGSPGAGIINATSNFPVISRELVLSLNEKEGKKNISTGFHAVEFLLWGQDLSVTGPGDRPWRDYTQEARNGDRRRECLRIVMELLVEHLESVVSAWSDRQAQNYRAEFLSLESDAALANILKGLGALSGPEMAGERMTVPYETKEQEEEQDCFSDNTRDDLANDALGIQNVYLGRYADINGGRVQGPGVHELLLRVNPALASKLAGQIESSLGYSREIPQPFDQAIQGTDESPGRRAVKRARDSLQAQSDLIAQAAKALKLRLNL